VRTFLEDVRQAVADYMQSEGCSCCSDRDAHKAAERSLAILLGVPPYDDESGYDFDRFATEPTVSAPPGAGGAR